LRHLVIPEFLRVHGVDWWEGRAVPRVRWGRFVPWWWGVPVLIVRTRWKICGLDLRDRRHRWRADTRVIVRRDAPSSLGLVFVVICIVEIVELLRIEVLKVFYSLS
jgi:hypothetical protein